MTTELPSAGWYPDPTGKPDQMYWDGRQWFTNVPAIAPPGAPANTPPPWTTTKSMSLVAVVLGSIGIITDFMCGAGILVAVVGLVVGVLARNRAIRYNEPQKLATSGIVVAAVALAFGLAWILLFGAFFAGV